MKFSTPIYNSGLTIVVKKKEQSFTWLFLSPFDYTLWITLLFLGFFHAHVIWFIERGMGDDFDTGYRKGILEALWFSFSSFFWMGDKEVKTIPGRMLMVFFWLMTIVIFGSYTTKLTFVLTNPVKYIDIQHYEDLDGKTVASYSNYGSLLRSIGAEVEEFPF